MNIIVVAIVIFIAVVFVIEMSRAAIRTIRNPNRRIIRKRLKTISTVEYADKPTDVLKRTRVLSDVSLLNQVLLYVPGVQRLDRLIQQANVSFTLGFFILISLVLSLMGFFVVSTVFRSTALSAIVAAFLGVIPLFYLLLKKKERMQKFERQFPDALELIARALRAGHAFTSGMKIAADEFADPLGPEFEATLDEINFGVSVSDALRHLAKRVECQDLNYFVVSVVLQRESGGNLAEIIDSIAYIIRERFKFRGKVRVLSAEGRLSAIILSAIPFLVFIALHFLNPKYISILLTEPAGRIMAGVSVLMICCAILIMKRMVKIRV